MAMLEELMDEAVPVEVVPRPRPRPLAFGAPLAMRRLKDKQPNDMILDHFEPKVATDIMYRYKQHCMMTHIRQVDNNSVYNNTLHMTESDGAA